MAMFAWLGQGCTCREGSGECSASTSHSSSSIITTSQPPGRHNPPMRRRVRRHRCAIPNSRVYGNSGMHMDNSNNAAKLEADGYMCVCLRPSICIVINVHVCTTKMLCQGALCVRVTCKNRRTRTHTRTRKPFLFRKLLHCGPPFLLLLLACSPPLFVFGLFPTRLLVVREERLNRG